MHSSCRRVCAVVLGTVLGLSGSSIASPFTAVRVGDRDGFGFGDGQGLLNFVGHDVNTDGVAILSPGDFLPDLNQDGLVQDYYGDDFENRSAAEIAGGSVTGSGFVDKGTSGSQFTDLALSHSYDSTFGSPNDFPDPPSSNRNNCLFVMRFLVDPADINTNAALHFNIVFGDVGLVPGELTLTYANGSSVTRTVSPINANVEDGLIAAASESLDFDDVFTVTTNGLSGYLHIEFVTRPSVQGGDPFYAVDFVELSVRDIEEDADGDGVPNQQDFCPNTIPDASVDSNGCPPVVPADCDRDGDVDLADFSTFVDCLNGPDESPAGSSCECQDLDADNDVDLHDFVHYQTCFSGMNVQGEPSCGN